MFSYIIDTHKLKIINSFLFQIHDLLKRGPNQSSSIRLTAANLLSSQRGSGAGQPIVVTAGSVDGSHTGQTTIKRGPVQGSLRPVIPNSSSSNLVQPSLSTQPSQQPMTILRSHNPPVNSVKQALTSRSPRMILKQSIPAAPRQVCSDCIL